MEGVHLFKEFASNSGESELYELVHKAESHKFNCENNGVGEIYLMCVYIFVIKISYLKD